MTWSKRMKHPSKMVKPGDEVDTIILSVNPNDRRISLGMKQLQDNPWEQLEDKYPTGAIIEGRVRNLTDFGAFIEIEDGIDGLVHVSNLSWTKRIKHPSEVLKKGEKVRAIVLGVEPENRRLSLGVKQLQPDVWDTFFAQHRVGDVIKGKICAQRSLEPSLRSLKESRACATSLKRLMQPASRSRWMLTRSTSSRSSR